MLISVIVTIYNSSATLKTCINSIINQKKFNNYEVILIDDGSTDNSYKIAMEYSIKYPNIVKAFTYPNSGVGMARFKGISNAKGDFIVFVDSDDTINPLLLKNIHDIIKLYPSLDIVRYQVNLLNDEDYKDHNRHNCMLNIYKPMSGVEALKLWSGPGMKYALYWLYAFRRELFTQNIEIPKLRCFEDVAYIPLLIVNSKSIITINYLGYNYECNNKHSLTNETNITKIRNRSVDFFKACDFAIKNFKKIGFILDDDVDLFVKDYQKRLSDYFYSLPDELRNELSHFYCLPVNREE